jgi:hypothetical protein
MATSSLSATREALSQLLSLTDEDGAPAGPTAPGDLNGELSSAPEAASQADVEEVIAELRGALGLDGLPDGSVSFFERLREGDEEYHLRYKLSPAASSGRNEQVLGQIDVGKVLTLTRHLPGTTKGEHGEPESQKASLNVEVQRTKELESGATVKTETTWEEGQLGPVELGALEGFLRPAVDLFRRGKE